MPCQLSRARIVTATIYVNWITLACRVGVAASGFPLTDAGSEMKYPSYSIMQRSFEIAALRKKRHRTSWISAVLDALYEARRRQAIRDIHRHRHLFRRPEHIALYQQAIGKSRATPADRRAAAPIKFSLPLILMQGALMAVLALFVALLLRVLA
jgi:hypothetical protein